MSDIVQRLRQACADWSPTNADGDAYGQAADEIERLRAENERLRTMLAQAKTIILAARVYIPTRPDDTLGHGWAKDADKWLAALATGGKE